MIRAKFSCHAIEHFNGQYQDPVTGAAVPGLCEIVKLTAVCGGPNSENAKWASWTPGGSLQMTISNPGAIGKFEVGKSYFLDFTPAPS